MRRGTSFPANNPDMTAYFQFSAVSGIVPILRTHRCQPETQNARVGSGTGKESLAILHGKISEQRSTKARAAMRDVTPQASPPKIAETLELLRSRFNGGTEH